MEIQADDYVITPCSDTENLLYEQVKPDPSYYYCSDSDTCRYGHRRSISWNKEMLNRESFSVPFQNTIRSSLTVFSISQSDEFLTVIGRSDLVLKPETQKQYDSSTSL